MDWSAIAPAIGAAAPTLGRLLGGALPIPFGGLIGDAVGSAVAAALGVEANPQAVGAAVGATRNDVLIAQLQATEAEAKAKYLALGEHFKAEAAIGAAEVTAVAQTQQAELTTGAWYQRWWRPLAMYVWVSTWPVQLGCILWHIGSKDAAAIQSLSTIVNSLAIWNAGPAALAGVYSFNRTTEKIAAADK